MEDNVTWLAFKGKNCFSALLALCFFVLSLSISAFVLKPKQEMFHCKCAGGDKYFTITLVWNWILYTLYIFPACLSGSCLKSNGCKV